MKTFYRNRLPHIAPIGATFFVTYRLADALPQHLVKIIKAELAAEVKRIKSENPTDLTLQLRNAKKKSFGKYEHQLDAKPYGACHLRKTAIAKLVIESWKKWDRKWYDLYSYCIMPNHVHILFDTSLQLPCQSEQLWTEKELEKNYVQLDKMMRRIKGSSARYINFALGRTGEKLWQKDSYDHYVRNPREWQNIIHYIINNPVKAGLVKHWKDWPYTFCTGDFSRRFNI